ncbi:MAG: hypothetical protein AAF219_10865 [Myxococcota bacterium]
MNVRERAIAPMLFESALRSHGFHRDAAAIAELSDKAFNDCLKLFSETPDFPTREDLVRMVSDAIDDQEIGESVVRFFLQMNTFRRQFDRSPEDFAEIVNERLKKLADEPLSEEGQTIVADRMIRIVEPLPTLERLAKARKLFEAVGSSVFAYDFYCDLRPVFDEDGTEVQGVVPAVVMSLSLEDPEDGLRTIQARLSSDDVEGMLSSLERVQNKLESLRIFAENKDISVWEVEE